MSKRTGKGKEAIDKALDPTTVPEGLQGAQGHRGLSRQALPLQLLRDWRGARDAGLRFEFQGGGQEGHEHVGHARVLLHLPLVRSTACSLLYPYLPRSMT